MITADEYKHAMRNLAQSVSILTMKRETLIAGMTVSSAASYSAEPPVFFAAINKTSHMAGHISLGDRVAMNLLNAEDRVLAEVFSGQTGVAPEDRFQHGDWEIIDTMSRAPRLKTALATFEGTLRALIPQASHAILLVDVENITERAGVPLLYHNRHYISDAF